MGRDNDYFSHIREKMDKYVHFVYKISKNFPKEELYGATSQLRRSSMSVVLNFIEGYSRINKKVKLNFWKISYGSLKESKYLLEFSVVEEWLSKEDFNMADEMADELARMLWRAIEPLKD